MVHRTLTPRESRRRYKADLRFERGQAAVLAFYVAVARSPLASVAIVAGTLKPSGNVPHAPRSDRCASRAQTDLHANLQVTEASHASSKIALKGACVGFRRGHDRQVEAAVGAYRERSA